MSFLTGSAPKATFNTQPTVDPTQQGIQQLLASLFQSGQQPAGVQAYGGQFAAPTSPLQDVSLEGLMQLAQGAGPQPGQTAAATGSLDALQRAFGYQAPQMTAPTAAAPSSVVAPQINSAQAFQSGVAQPMIDDFISQVLPAISGAAGRSAGGAYSSDTELAKALATKQLTRTLAQQGSLYDLGAQQANQGASLTAQTTNQTAANQISLADLSAALSTGQSNQAASLTGQQDILSALGITPSVVSGASAPANNAASLLSTTLAGGAVPQTTQQQQITGQYQDYIAQINQANLLRQLMAGFGTTPTQQTIGVGTGGTSGILPGLLQAGGQLGAAAITASDRRLKDDFGIIGRLDNKLPVHLFRYKGDTKLHMGLMADEVERVRPEAVAPGPGGYKTVNYVLAALETL